MKQSGIVFPCSNKRSQTDATMVPKVSHVSNKDILEIVKEAMEAMEKLGMADTFNQNGDWINPCSTMRDEFEIDEDDDSSEEDSESESEVEDRQLSTLKQKASILLRRHQIS